MESEVKDFAQHVEKQREANQNRLQNFRDYGTKFVKKTTDLKKNYDNFEKQLKSGQVVNQKELNSTPLKDLFDVPPDAVIPEWFDAFKQSQIQKLGKALEDMAQRLYKARVTDEMKQNREKLCAQATQIFQDLTQNYDDARLPLEKLVQFEKLVCELQQYDAIIPQLTSELAAKAAEYVQRLLMQAVAFNVQAGEEIETLKKSNFASDDAFRYEFNNVKLMEPTRVRANRYNIVLKNSDLASLHAGEWMSESLPFFFIEYLRERNRYQAMKELQQIVVMRHDFFEQLVPPGGVLDWNNLNYAQVRTHTAEYKGAGNTIFDRFARVLIGALLSANNFVLIEVRNRPDREILVYDSDFASFSIFHEKLVRCVRAYVIQETRDKTDWPEGKCIEFAQRYVGRSANCPQVQFPHENALFFLKNLHLAADGKNISPVSYRADQLAPYRLSLFSAALRIGVNQDRAIPQDVLV